MSSSIRIRIEHERMVEKERREPLNVTREQWLSGNWPVGSKWYGSLGGAYGPPGSAVQPDRRSGE